MEVASLAAAASAMATPRARTSDTASLRDSTRATAAAANSPTEWPATTPGEMSPSAA